MEYRSQQFTNSIKEMEGIESILEGRWRQAENSGAIGAKNGIEELFGKLKERQAITNAALKQLDRFDQIQQEMVDFNQRERNISAAFEQWLNHEGISTNTKTEGLTKEQKKRMKQFKNYRESNQNLQERWTEIEEADKDVYDEVNKLTSTFANYPNKLREMTNTELQKPKWPNKQIKKVSDATEMANDLLDFVSNSLLNDVEESLEKLEAIFRIDNHNGMNEVEFSNSSHEMYQHQHHQQQRRK